MKTIEMQQIYLRETTFEDCTLFAEWETDPAVTRFFTMNRDRSYEEIVTEFVQRKEEKDKLQLTICSLQDDQPVGRIYISGINDHYDSLDISRIYIADPQKRGYGLGEEALRAALKLAFEELNCERVTLDHFLENKIAAGLYQKVGFQPEGVMRHGGKKDGAYVDLRLMSILRSEYLNA